MRVLLLLRGCAGVGKTTWIEKNGLTKYALSADEIRMMCSSPCLNIDGREEINPDNDADVWATLMKLLEIRMRNGEFTVIDATNSKTSEMNKYKQLCDEYKYRIYCVDFTDVPMEEVKKRNLMRPEYKQVPEKAIEKMYARFASQKIPSGITVIRPDELDKVWLKQIDLSGYKKIHHIGDIHGCYTALKEYFDKNGGMHDDEFYIFTGDYIDRGIENVEVINFLLKIYNQPNVLLLEGNHERWIWLYANDGVSKSREFEMITRTQLENAHIDKKELRKFYRKIGQCAYYRYGNNVYLVTHAGLSALPKNLTLVATSQMIKGVGGYNDFEAVDESFVKNTPDNCYQIHGHRNTKMLPVHANDRVFNLEGRVEFGGHLRCVQIAQDGTENIIEIKNDVFREIETEKSSEEKKAERTLFEHVSDLRANKYVNEKKFGNISSFNFTKAAFHDRVWDEQTTKARGLFINIPKQKVVARSYDKFFNINERPETKLDMLQYKLEFPVQAYVKENGFLALVSYNEEDDCLFITSKSDPTSEFSGWFRRMFFSSFTKDTLDRIKNYIRENNVTFVFECVDTANDPHIIKYPESDFFLLDIVYNDINFRKYDFNELCKVADCFGMRHKELAYTLESWQDFFDWYYKVTDEDYMYNDRHIEGFVVVGANNYMVKVKLAYYNFWKFMRAVSQEVIRIGYAGKKSLSGMTDKLSNDYYGWLKSLRLEKAPEEIPKDIISLRDMFYESYAGEECDDIC